MQEGTPFSLHCGHSGDISAIGLLVDSLELDVVVALLGLRLLGLVHDGDGPARVQTTEIPGMRATLADDLVRDEGLGFVEGMAVAECAIYYYIFRGKH